MKTFFYSFYQHQELLTIIYKSDKKIFIFKGERKCSDMIIF